MGNDGIMMLLGYRSDTIAGLDTGHKALMPGVNANACATMLALCIRAQRRRINALGQSEEYDPLRACAGSVEHSRPILDVVHQEALSMVRAVLSKRWSLLVRHSDTASLRLRDPQHNCPSFLLYQQAAASLLALNSGTVTRQSASNAKTLRARR